jgi:hypothetical protein
VPVEIRDLLVERLREIGTLVPAADQNWRVAPDAVWAAPSPPRPAPPGG